MNLLVFSGSPRKYGNTSRLAKEFTKLLEVFGIHYDFVMTRDNFNTCQACGYCAIKHTCKIDDWIKPYVDNFKKTN